MKLNLSVKIQKVKTCLLVQKPESWVCTLKVLPSQIITLIMAEIQGYFAYLLLNISKVSKICFTVKETVAQLFLC